MLRLAVCVMLLTTSVSMALPPEGFENFAILNRGKVGNYFAGNFGYQAPSWRTDFETADSFLGLKVGENLLSLGAKSMVAPRSGERAAYAARFDWVMFKTHSLALKYIHEEWSYIASAKEVWGMDYNLFAPFGSGNSGFYMAFGYYYRWLKQRWNEPWGDPFNYNTRDQESFFQGVFGFKIPLFSDDNFFTFDINWRDSFSYYNFDNMAFDFGMYFPGDGFLLRLNGGIRTSALTMGTAHPAEYYGGLGFQFY